MNKLFEHSSSHWVRYSTYEYRKAQDGHLYLTPTADAKPMIYDPLKDADAMVLEAVNVGMLCMNRASEETIQAATLQFVTHYGLLGLMTALSTTPTFMDYKAVYLPANHFIRAESMETEEYIALFMPFNQLTLNKKGKESRWDLTDRTAMALTMTFADSPRAVQMSFQREYAERYDWIIAQFKDWAFAFCSGFFFYDHADSLDADTKNLYRKGMAAFNGIAPSYHIELREHPTIVWDFHSLLLAIHMMFSLMLTDGKTPLKMCKHCKKVFVAGRCDTVFCSPQCKNQYNVYKSREKQRTSESSIPSTNRKEPQK